MPVWRRWFNCIQKLHVVRIFEKPYEWSAERTQRLVSVRSSWTHSIQRASASIGCVCVCECAIKSDPLLRSQFFLRVNACVRVLTYVWVCQLSQNHRVFFLFLLLSHGSSDSSTHLHYFCCFFFFLFFLLLPHHNHRHFSSFLSVD